MPSGMEKSPVAKPQTALSLRPPRPVAGAVVLMIALLLPMSAEVGKMAPEAATAWRVRGDRRHLREPLQSARLAAKWVAYPSLKPILPITRLTPSIIRCTQGSEGFASGVVSGSEIRKP